MTGTIIQLEKLVKKFRGVTALDGVTFDVAEGSRFALIGPTAQVKPPLLTR